jgi:hypothetical protein
MRDCAPLTRPLRWSGRTTRRVLFGAHRERRFGDGSGSGRKGARSAGRSRLRRRLVRVSDGPPRRPCRSRQVALLGVETSFGSPSRHFGGVKLRSNAQLGRYGRTLRGGNVGFRDASPLLRREASGAEMVAGLLCRPRLRARSRPGDRGAFFGRCGGRSRRGGSEVVGELGWRVVCHDDGRVVARSQRSRSRAFGHGEDASLVARSSGFGFGWGQAGCYRALGGRGLPIGARWLRSCPSGR